MASQSAALQLILQAINAMREAGYTQEDTQELASHAWEHLEGGTTRPLRLRPLHRVQPPHHRLVSLPVDHLGPRILPSCGKPW